MASQLHEVLVLLFKNRPELAPLLLREALEVELPHYTEVRIECADLTNVVPTEYRADLVVLLVDGKPVLGIIVEVQLRADEDKRLVWPVYVATLRARIRCVCVLLVITADPKVARWAAGPIPLGGDSRLVPLVLGPHGVPIVTDPQKAKQNPELAVLSVMAHGKGEVATAVAIAAGALTAAGGLDEDTRTLYFDLVESALGDAARKALSMLPQNYQFQGPTFLKGKLEGQALGEADAVITILQARGIAITDTQRDAIMSCTDLDVIKSWVRRAITVQAADDLFHA